MKNNFKYLLIAFLAFTITNDFAQDTRLSQAYSNQLMLNPAMMGANTDLRVSMNYRSQWKAIENGYNTYAFSLICPVFLKEGKEKLDIGFNTYSDKAGIFSTMNYALSVGYSLKLSNSNYLSAALTTGYLQKSLSTSALTFDEQYVLGQYNSSNPVSELIPNTKVGYTDVGFSAMWFYNPDDKTNIKAYAGASVFHLNTPNESLMNEGSQLPFKISFQGGITILGEKVDFVPNIRITGQSGAEEISAGLCMNYKLNDKAKFVVGTWYRTHDAISVAVGIEHKSFIFGYSYDIVTDLNKYVASANANEISLSYKFNMAEKKGVKIIPSVFPVF